MSVVIRDIDKPEDCDYCLFQTNGYCDVLLSFINVEHGIDPRCPVVEISGYTLKNGHKVVVADTPQTEPAGCDKGWSSNCTSCERYFSCDYLSGRHTDCGWK